jgi:hypothetical protein
MRVSNSRIGIYLLAGAMLSVGGPTQAQESILLRYHPQVGMAIPTVTWTDMLITMGELAVGGEPGTLSDTLSFEVSIRHTLTDRVLEMGGREFVVERSLDSARGRMRTVGGTWNAIPSESMRPGLARLVVSDRLQVVEFEPIGADSLADLTEDWMRNAGGGLALVLPEEPVTVGAGWAAEVVFPFHAAIDLDEEGAGFAQRAALVAQATITLDSLVARGADTLAYLELRGTFLPLTITQAAEVAQGSATVTGAFAGRLIWSTGWGRFVSGATRAEVFMRLVLSTPDFADSEMGMRFDIRSRFQLRP